NLTTLGEFGSLRKGHGIRFGDIDHSGDQDVVEEIGGAFTCDKFWTAIYKNPAHGNHWVKLRLTGGQANRFAVGARIRAVVEDAGKRREIFYTVGSGGSFGAQSLRPALGRERGTA